MKCVSTQLRNEVVLFCKDGFPSLFLVDLTFIYKYFKPVDQISKRLLLIRFTLAFTVKKIKTYINKEILSTKFTERHKREKQQSD